MFFLISKYICLNYPNQPGHLHLHSRNHLDYNDQVVFIWSKSIFERPSITPRLDPVPYRQRQTWQRKGCQEMLRFFVQFCLGLEKYTLRFQGWWYCWYIFLYSIPANKPSNVMWMGDLSKIQILLKVSLDGVCLKLSESLPIKTTLNSVVHVASFSIFKAYS